VLRDLLATDDFSSRPRADITLEELEIRLGGDRQDRFPVTVDTQVSVELEPGVVTIVPTGVQSEQPYGPLGMGAEERRVIARELAASITRLVELHQRVTDTMPSGEQIGQRGNQDRGNRKKR
jgi:hypothetical protein